MDAESTFRNALGMCQMYLRQKAAETLAAHTPETIRQAVEAITAIPIYSNVDKTQLFEELEIRVTVYSPIHRTLGGNDDHEPWLETKRGQISWRFWDRFVLHLAERIPDESVKSLDEVTNDIFSRLEDPARPGAWDRRGLVMGNVQAGKTDNYTGLICKAADAGYKVIIVLSGLHNNLRAQTQVQLDEGFLGFMSEPRSGAGQQNFRPVGVGEIDGSIHANTGTNRTERGDFSTAVATQWGIHPGGLPLLFVVKKNVSVLSNLLGWIRSHATGNDPVTDRRFVRNVPVLVIDDEADQASVDTKQQTFDAGTPDPEHSPTRINELIRTILRSFEKIAYVGYTATPFANIFIHERGETRELGEDLFPRSFIVNIPPPSNYVGAAKVFGIRGEDESGLDEIEPLPIVRIVADHAASDSVDEEHGWMPPKLVARTAHRPLYNGKQAIPPSLREAMMVFVLSTAVRKLREHRPHHNSMLVHVVRYTDVQKLVADQVQEALREILQRLQYGDGGRTPTILDEFSLLWEGEKGFRWCTEECRRIIEHRATKGVLGERRVSPLPSWSAVEGLLLEITASIKVKTINGSARDVLEYETYRAAGMNVIAIGGDKLSRGLTLYGLSVSYFLRASQMYDTLMQMGRWFGYRDGYVDVCRLYTTAELLEWFAHIAVASEELQREFKYMWDIGGTPREYGLKVRSHPVMLVTSAVKMRHGTEMPLSFSGKLSETIIFANDPGWIARNFSATENWLMTLGKPVEGRKSGGYRWNEVSAQSIIEFLRSYSTHREVSQADTALWIKYITTQLSHDELTRWTVLLNSSGPGNERVISNLRVGLIERDQDPCAKIGSRYTTRQIVDPNDEIQALTEEQRKIALSRTLTRWQARNERRPDDKPPTRPGREDLRAESVRPKTHGLLLIYPLDPTYPKIKECGRERLVLDEGVKPVIGLALSFPESNTARPISYVVNNVYTQRGGDSDTF